MENNETHAPRPGFFQSIADSVTKPERFDYFRRVKFWSAVGFLALLLFLYQIVISLQFAGMTAKGLGKLADYYQKNLPEIRIEKGEVKTNVKMPYVKFDKKENVAILIDTSGKTKDLEKYPRGILLMKSKMIIKNNKYDVKTYDLSKVEKFTLNSDMISSWKKGAFVFLFPVLLLLGFFWEAFKMLILVPIMGFMSKQVGAGNARQYSFGEHANIAIYSAVPALLVSLLLGVTGLAYRMPGILKGIIFLIVFAVFVFRNTKGAIAGEQSGGSPVRDSSDSYLAKAPGERNTDPKPYPPFEDPADKSE